jgi:PAS domain S-box-containing protein
MKDESKTKAQLITELRDLRQKIEGSDARQMERVLAQGALLESAAAAIIIIDEAGRIMLVNAGAETMFGYTREEMTGQPLEILLPRHSAETHVHARNSFFAHPRVRSMGIGLDLVGRHKDGHEFPIEVGLSYTQTEHGMLAMSFIIDVTERRRGEMQRRLMERAIDAATNGIVISDARKPEMPIIYVNPAFERITGYSRAEVVGRNCRFLQADDHDQPALEELRAALREGRSCQVVLRNYRKDGTLFWNELALAPVHDEEDRLLNYVGVQNDITERKRADERLAHKNQELDSALIAAEEATRAKSEFLANMSHEIRTPLNAVIGMAGLLLDTNLTAEQREYAETVRTSSDSLLAIVNDILDFSKIEASRLELERQPFDLRACIEESLDLLAPTAAHKDLELGYLIDDNVPLTLIGDVTRVRQILVNLLSNAVKFTDHGEVIVNVNARELGSEIGDLKLETGSSDGNRQSSIVNSKSPVFELTFAVRDTGIGIPEDHREWLFQPFNQLDTSTTRRYGGTGLGLAISMRLCELMGGRIWVESSGVPEQGSTFYFTIKAEAADTQDISGAANVPTELTGRRALIVDDNATNRLILMRQIEPWGMTGRETPTGHEALQWVRQGEAFDIAILDVRMPEMDGMTLARELHALRPEMPLVILTSMGRREPELSDLKVSAFLVKPIKPAQLYRVLTASLRGQSTPPSTVAPRERGAGSIDTHMGLRHPLRILLAEDNIVNQKVAVRILERLGYRPDVVANGLEVLQALERQSYDVVLMDVQMPEMDGLETTRHILQRWPRDMRPRLIAMTAYALEGDRERCIAAGMDDYISKPIRMQELVNSLEQSQSSRLPSRPEQAQTTPRHAPGSHPAVDPAVIDNLRTVLRDETGEVVNIFLENGARLMEEMRQALLKQDSNAIERAAHTLKSSSATFGALTLSALCKELELLGRQNQLAGAEEKVRCAESEFERVKVEIVEIVK